MPNLDRLILFSSLTSLCNNTVLLHDPCVASLHWIHPLQQRFSNYGPRTTCGMGGILQAFRLFIYVTAHSPTFPSLYLRHNTFYNPSVPSPTPQQILQPFFRFYNVTGFSLTSPGEPHMTCGPRGLSFFDILHQGSSTFWIRGPIYIFHIILWATVIADCKNHYGYIKRHHRGMGG